MNETYPGHFDRAILHVDMDAFFAAIEELDDPSLRGKPVIVGGTPEGHGVVSTANYVARRFGVHSALPAAQAVRRCPQGVFLPVRMRRYVEVSRQVMEIFQEVTPDVEPLSIDEAFLDVTGSQRLEGDPPSIARKIKERIRERTGGLTASVGVARCKFLAKIASDLRKPDGLVVVEPGAEEAFLAPLPVDKLWGVGPRTRAALNSAGIFRVADLQERTERSLVSRFGEETGRHLYRLAHARDDRSVHVERDRKSISCETTLGTFIPGEDVEALDRLLLALSEELSHRLWRQRACGETLTIKVRDHDFRTVTRSRKLHAPLQLTDDLYREARDLFREKIDLRGRRLRLLGIGLSGLHFGDPVQLDLLDAPRQERATRVRDSLEQLRAKHGAGLVKRASLLESPYRREKPK